MDAAFGTQRRKERKRRMLLANAVRFAAVCVCTMVMILIACGFLYILDHLFKKDSMVYGEVVNADTADGGTNENSSAKESGDRLLTGKTVVIETGFLSNSGDREKLSESGYQKELAAVIADGAAEILNEP